MHNGIPVVIKAKGCSFMTPKLEKDLIPADANILIRKVF